MFSSAFLLLVDYDHVTRSDPVTNSIYSSIAAKGKDFLCLDNGLKSRYVFNTCIPILVFEDACRKLIFTLQNERYMETPMSHTQHEIHLSDHFGYGHLLRYTLPSIVMMIFTSIYSVVDGFFVSNFAGKAAFTAVNFIMPVLLILGCVGFMFGTGGGALIAMTMGMGDKKRANEQFSMLVYVSIAIGVLLAVLGIAFLPQIAQALGAEGELLENSVLYGRIITLAVPAYILQYEFQCLFATAEKPRLGLIVTVAAGLTNMVLDAVLVGVFGMGLVGAAAATAISQCVGGVIPLVYFADKRNDSRLHLVAAPLRLDDLGKACLNGSSELMSNIAMSLVGMLYNAQLLRYIGQDGVAAYGVLMYVSMIFQAIFIGYAVGCAPVVSYHYGAGTEGELHSLLQKSLKIICITAVAMFAAAELLAGPLARIFVSYDAELLELTRHAFYLYSFSFLLSGFSIYGSSFFTALNNGLISALISFLRTLLFQCAAVWLLPLMIGVDGIWISIPIAELLAIAVTAYFLITKRSQYHY